MKSQLDKIVQAKKSDIPDMCQVHKTVWLNTYATDSFGLSPSDILTKDFDSLAKIQKWQNLLEDYNYKLWLAKVDHQIVGFCGARRGDHENDFSVVYILPEFQRRGIGQKFAQKVLAWFGTEKPVKVEVASKNLTAIDFYHKLGFTDIQSGDPVLLTNGKKIDITKMYKQ